MQISQLQQTLLARLMSLKQSKKLKNNELAAIISVSEGTMSDILSSKKTFSDKLIQQCLARISDYNIDFDVVPVRQFNQITSILTTCKTKSDMRLIIGNTGIGKSLVTRKFAKDNADVYYFKVDRSYTWKDLLAEICKIMGIEPKLRGAKHLLNNIIQKIEQTSGNNPLLIIDESEVLTNPIYKHIKNLYTATEGLLGIAIVGITEIQARIAKIAGLDNTTWFPIKSDSNQYTTFARRLVVHRIPNIGYDVEGIHDIDVFMKNYGITNAEVLAAARVKIWNYGEANRIIQRANKMNFKLSELTINEFEIL